MASLDQTINISILKGPAGVARKNFGRACWLTFEQYSTQHAAVYADIDEVNAVYPSDSTTRDAATVHFGQTPRPENLVIGTTLGNVNLVPVAVDTSTYEVQINGITISYVSDASATVAEITAGLVAAIDAHGTIGPLTTTVDNVTSLDVFSANTTPINVRIPTSSTALFATVTHTDLGSQSHTTQLDLVRQQNDTWFVLITHVVTQSLQLIFAAYIAPLNKMYCWLSRDADDLVAATLTSTGALLKALQYPNVFGVRDSSLVQRKDMAFVGKVFTRDIGQVTGKFKVLTGVSVDTFTSTQQAGLEAKDINYYSDIVLGVPITQEGKTASGEYIDVQRNISWFHSNLQLDLLDLFRQNDIIHIDDDGLLLIDGVIRGRVSDAVARRAFHDTAEVIVPNFEQLQALNPAAREVKGVKVILSPVQAAHFVRVVVNITS